ncbi:MAG: HAD hydrolase-like protein [Candidatus Paceibacterota bacterium]
MKNEILFVWDFHGTLEKGNVYAVQELVNLVLKDFGTNKEITVQEAIDWYGLSWFDYFKLAVAEGNQQLWQSMVDKVLSLQQQSWNNIKNYIKVRDFAEEVLQQIQNEGHQNILLSNTRLEQIRMFTDLLDLTHYFNEIIGVDTHRNSRINNEIHNVKSEALTNFLKGKNYGKIIMVGDKENDMRAGKSCGATTYLLTDQKIDKGSKTETDHIISDLREVLKELEF